MAYPDHGALLPTEALFTEPGAYTGVLKGEAQKRASYLSSMDQFYAQLTQASEQFTKQYSLAEKEFEFGMEEAEWERGFKEKALGQEKTLAQMQQARASETSRMQYELGMEELGLEREQMEKELTGREEFEMASSFLKELYPTETGRGEVFPEGREAIPLSPYEKSTEMLFG